MSLKPLCPLNRAMVFYFKLIQLFICSSKMWTVRLFLWKCTSSDMADWSLLLSVHPCSALYAFLSSHLSRPLELQLWASVWCDTTESLCSAGLSWGGENGCFPRERAAAVDTMISNVKWWDSPSEWSTERGTDAVFGSRCGEICAISIIFNMKTSLIFCKSSSVLYYHSKPWYARLHELQVDAQRCWY